MISKSALKGLKESIRIKKQKAKRIIENATRSAARPLSLTDIKALQTDNHLDIETFYENIGGIFPFILERVQEGMSISRIEKLIGLNDRVLENILQRYPRLNVVINEARSLKTDDSYLTAR